MAKSDRAEVPSAAAYCFMPQNLACDSRDPDDRALATLPSGCQGKTILSADQIINVYFPSIVWPRVLLA